MLVLRASARQTRALGGDGWRGAPFSPAALEKLYLEGEAENGEEAGDRPRSQLKSA